MQPSIAWCPNCLAFILENKSKRELIRMLVQKGYESDPVVAWTKAQEKVLYPAAHTLATLRLPLLGGGPASDL